MGRTSGSLGKKLTCLGDRLHLPERDDTGVLSLLRAPQPAPVPLKACAVGYMLIAFTESWTRSMLCRYTRTRVRIVFSAWSMTEIRSTDFAKPIEFQSVLSMDVQKEAQCDPARVHVLYGYSSTSDPSEAMLTFPCSMSKDFGSNGLRIGLLVSQHNPDLIKSFAVSNILMKVSSPAVCAACPIPADQADLLGRTRCGAQSSEMRKRSMAT